MKIALKVDCDTAIGSREGIPRLLSLFEEFRIRASFFFSFGPDHSGRAILRVLTQKGFLRKMLRSRAPSLYPKRTLLSGTLLPAPEIGRVARDQIRSAAAAGHECGVHAWDHVGWHDHLDAWSGEKIASQYRRAHEVFEAILGRKAAASACPGWTVNEDYLAVRETYPLLYTSDTRGGAPFFPRLRDTTSRILEIPSTLPTLDELLGDPQYPGPEDLLKFYARDVPATPAAIHTIHTEVEGGPWSTGFRELLTAWKSAGTEFVTMEDVAREQLLSREEIPSFLVGKITLPGRGGTVACAARGASAPMPRGR